MSGVPEFVAVGHVTHDLTEGGVRLGGAALFSAVTARRLGMRAAVFTSHGEDYEGAAILEGISTRIVPAAQTSTFRNVYSLEGRVQMVYGSAGPLEVREFPEAWRSAEIVYLCPVLHEVPLEMGNAFPGALVGVAPQGWMRTWDEQGRIRSRRWEGFEDLLRHATVLVASEKDIEGNEDLVACFRTLTPIVILTRAERGATIYLQGTTIEMGVFPAEEKDPTGAGDCFGASFLIRYSETRDVIESARFASCVASFAIEDEGILGVPDRKDVVRRMKEVSIPWREIPV